MSTLTQPNRIRENITITSEQRSRAMQRFAAGVQVGVIHPRTGQTTSAKVISDRMTAFYGVVVRVHIRGESKPREVTAERVLRKPPARG